MGLRGGGQFGTFCRKKTESVTCKVTKFGKPQKVTKSTKASLKAGEPSHHWLGPRFGGKHWRNARKVSWRSGRRRSGDVGGGGTATVSVFSVSCRVSTEHALCQEPDCRFPIVKSASGNRQLAIH